MKDLRRPEWARNEGEAVAVEEAVQPPLVLGSVVLGLSGRPFEPFLHFLLGDVYTVACAACTCVILRAVVLRLVERETLFNLMLAPYAVGP
jgi:hypothetical protein